MRKLIFSLYFATLAVQAAREEPNWEAGIGPVFAATPHYMGADQGETYFLPAPYFVYRGKYLRADRSGLRGVLYESDKLDLRLSLAGSIKVDSEDNEAREGMNNLDFVVEVGPTLQYQLYQDNRHLWRLDLPLRSALTAGSGSDFMNHIGWTGNPRIYYQRNWSEWTATASIGPVFSDRSYHSYYYDVGVDDVTATRPEYDADGGYTGSRLALGVRRRYDQWFVGGFLSYYNLQGAAYEDSPLVRQDHYLAVALVWSWVFAESKNKAQKLED